LNNIVLVSYFLLVSDKKPEEPKLSAVKDDKQALLEKEKAKTTPTTTPQPSAVPEKSFMQELMTPPVLFAYTSIFFYFTSFKLVQEWAIKFCQAKGLTWDEGAYIIYCLSITSIIGRLGSGVVAI